MMVMEGSDDELLCPPKNSFGALFSKGLGLHISIWKNQYII